MMEIKDNTLNWYSNSEKEDTSNQNWGLVKCKFTWDFSPFLLTMKVLLRDCSPHLINAPSPGHGDLNLGPLR